MDMRPQFNQKFNQNQSLQNTVRAACGRKRRGEWKIKTEKRNKPDWGKCHLFAQERYRPMEL
jgi:hypothetical protein